MASSGDLRAAQLSRSGLSYSGIAEQLGHRDRRAAHRAVLRGLAAAAEAEAALRGSRMLAVDAQLSEVQSQLWQLQERIDPEMVGGRRYFQVVDTLLRVNDRHCRLWGLYTHPYRWDLWYRRDVPVTAWAAGQRKATRLERQSRVPVSRCRSSIRKVALSVTELTVAPSAEADALVPVTVRRLLAQTAA